MTHEKGKISEHECARLRNKFLIVEEMLKQDFSQLDEDENFYEFIKRKFFPNFFFASCHRVALMSFLLPMTYDFPSIQENQISN